MTKLRVLVGLLTLLVVGTLSYFISFYARGYRLDVSTLKFVPNGLLVLNSNPEAAQVFINGELKTATNATLSISPGTYDIEVRKEAYLPWKKRVVVEKEVVTQVSAHLFRSVPSFSAITFSGALNPVATQNSTKIAYTVPPEPTLGNDEKSGLWIMEVVNLPLGFNREPRRITDGDLTEATYMFSPDSNQILLTVRNSIFILETNTFTPQSQRVNVAARLEEIMTEWQEQERLRTLAKTRNLPDELREVLERRSKIVTFSPDENKVLYSASSSAHLAENLIPQIPGASSQEQKRNIEIDQTYVYDTKEDRNFLIEDGSKSDIVISWFPTSSHLVEASENKITIMDYDGTNRQVVYTGPYIAPFAFPFAGVDKLLILTNLGTNSLVSNLYSLNLK